MLKPRVSARSRLSSGIDSRPLASVWGKVDRVFRLSAILSAFLRLLMSAGLSIFIAYSSIELPCFCDIARFNGWFYKPRLLWLLVQWVEASRFSCVNCRFGIELSSTQSFWSSSGSFSNWMWRFTKLISCSIRSWVCLGSHSNFEDSKWLAKRFSVCSFVSMLKCSFSLNSSLCSVGTYFEFRK